MEGSPSPACSADAVPAGGDDSRESAGFFLQTLLEAPRGIHPHYAAVHFPVLSNGAHRERTAPIIFTSAVAAAGLCLKKARTWCYRFYPVTISMACAQMYSVHAQIYSVRVRSHENAVEHFGDEYRFGLAL
ncbi:hypothetical protein MTO96_025926 [Rhipicephalus appendiculatus]